ncbi:hypothetical protein Rhe02_32920 [Rhizocola hellebori]|uniref:DUF2029 domain-containing protein n=1 Tax=Rhizocola hellebori TaxID=1392758 RepID=A0A8J3Q8W1_9ACTN|nr:glycosyltransferase 87 family protein [Rhizocola hellebori]GIH05225.1 hypothetical protein Rhe02_32920 [Rhizocola hellebori]
MKHLRSVSALACVALLTVCVWWLVHPAPWQGSIGWYVFMAGAWLLFGTACWLIRKVPRRAAATLIVVGGIALPLAAGFAPPRTSDDLYRYLWDGRVQTSGVDPYRHVPAATELAGLRDDFLWPQHSAWCVAPGSGLMPGCTMINRPVVNTIYPPVAQAYFASVAMLSPEGSRERPIQLASALFAVATTILLLLALPRAGGDPRWAALWAWCPLVALEAGNNAHLDVVGAFLVASALLVAAQARSWRGTAAGAVLFGLAIAAKITPVLIGPSLLRRRPLTVIAAAGATLAAVYLPYVLATGPGVLGYLPGYLSEEGYRGGTRFALLAPILPPTAATAAAALILLAAALICYWKTDPARPWDTATVLTGVFLLVSTPAYSWYAILLVVMVALSGRVEWLAVALAGYVAQYSSNLHLHGTHAQQVGYGVAALMVAAVFAVRAAARWQIRLAAPGLS